METNQSNLNDVGVLTPAFWAPERCPQSVDSRLLELKRDELSRLDDPISTVAELRGALGVKNYKFFAARHPFAYRIKDIVDSWDVPGPKISAAIKNELLPEPVKVCGPGKQIVTAAMVGFMFSSRSGRHGLATLCSDRNFITAEPGLKLPFTGAGSSPQDSITLILDPQSGRLLADQDAILLAGKVWFKLTVWVDLIEGILPHRPTIPADPIEAIKVLVGCMEGGHSHVHNDALANVQGIFRSDQYAEALAKVDILAAKITGGEAPYIKKCLWLALLAATLPWSKEGMLTYVNRLIESDEGQKLSLENLGDRLYLAKHYMLLLEKQDEHDYQVLPSDLKTGKFLQKFGDNEIPLIWKYICRCLLRGGHKYPTLRDLVSGYEEYVAEKALQDQLEKPVALTAEKKEIVEASIELNFTKVASQFRLSLRQTRSLDPQEAFTRLLKAKGFNTTAIEDAWMALTSTDAV